MTTVEDVLLTTSNRRPLVVPARRSIPKGRSFCLCWSTSSCIVVGYLDNHDEDDDGEDHCEDRGVTDDILKR